MTTKKYDTKLNVCDNQDDFNYAVESAVRNVNRKYEKRSLPWTYVYMSFWTIFIIWATILALAQPQGPQRIVHLVFAILFSPVYVLANAFNLL